MNIRCGFRSSHCAALFRMATAHDALEPEVAMLPACAKEILVSGIEVPDKLYCWICVTARRIILACIEMLERNGVCHRATAL